MSFLRVTLARNCSKHYKNSFFLSDNLKENNLPSQPFVSQCVLKRGVWAVAHLAETSSVDISSV